MDAAIDELSGAASTPKSSKQPPRPSAPDGVTPKVEITPEVRAQVEALMAEQRTASTAPKVEPPPDHLIVRSERSERTGGSSMIPMTEEWVAMPPPYDNLLLLLWVDFPPKLAKMIDSKEHEQVLSAAKRIVLGHSSWEDEDGVLPAPNLTDFWERLAPRIQVQVMRSILRGMIRLPN